MEYVPRGVKKLSEEINIMYDKCKLGLFAKISSYECYIYAFIGELLGDQLILYMIDNPELVHMVMHA